MVQGDFTRQEAKATEEAFKEVFNALSRQKARELVGNANDIYLFLAACQRKCPDAPEQRD